MRDYEIWRTELVSEIRTIANADELKRLWSGLEPHAISSFAEEVAHVFDDYDIDGFIAAEPNKAKLNIEQFAALRRFRDRFAAYVDGMVPAPLTAIDHETVLADPKWGEVTRTALEFIVLLDAQPA
jgi:hypothetical protein